MGKVTSLKLERVVKKRLFFFLKGETVGSLTFHSQMKSLYSTWGSCDGMCLSCWFMSQIWCNSLWQTFTIFSLDYQFRESEVAPIHQLFIAIILPILRFRAGHALSRLINLLGKEKDPKLKWRVPQLHGYKLGLIQMCLQACQLLSRQSAQLPWLSTSLLLCCES